MKKLTVLCSILCLVSLVSFSQNQEQQKVIDNMIQEAVVNSQLEILAHQLMDVIGPRLVGTPQMKEAGDWIVETYQGWGISAKTEQWGTWKAWERGVTHIDMLSPRLETLTGMQLAWNPSTGSKGVTAETIVMPKVIDSLQFANWLPNVKGKFVLLSMKQPTGRPDNNWKAFATEASYKKMKGERNDQVSGWYSNFRRAGYNSRSIVSVFENAGAAGIIDSYWSKGFGVNRIFSAKTKSIPHVDLELEDYTMLYRLTESGNTPKLKIVAESKDLGIAPAFNTLGEIRGSEKPEEYVILSAHLDTWDGATGATDNGTGTIVMMEAMRLLKKFYPNPKRTILVGHWDSEEQGLNGSSAFVEDHPEIVNNIQALFNQDDGTGRVVNISGAGFLHSYKYLTRWLAAVPNDITQHIKTEFPGSPKSSGSDNVSFLAAGAPAFDLSALSWSYHDYTWHTNRDTYDKIVFDDVRSNAILTAILVYMASEDPDRTPTEKIVLPINPRTGKQEKWPKPRIPNRKGNQN